VLDAPAKCSVLQRAREMKSAAIAAGAHSCGNCQCAVLLPRLRRCEAQARRSQERSRRDHPNGCKRGRKGQLDVDVEPALALLRGSVLLVELLLQPACMSVLRLQVRGT
jgi:hypothetical protein